MDYTLEDSKCTTWTSLGRAETYFLACENVEGLTLSMIGPWNLWILAIETTRLAIWTLR